MGLKSLFVVAEFDSQSCESNRVVVTSLCAYIDIYLHVYVYIFQRGYAPFRRAWAVGFGTLEGEQHHCG